MENIWKTYGKQHCQRHQELKKLFLFTAIFQSLTAWTVCGGSTDGICDEQSTKNFKITEENSQTAVACCGLLWPVELFDVIGNKNWDNKHSVLFSARKGQY